MVVELIIGIVIIVMAIVITVAVLLQSSKDDHLSGAIAGGAETFFGKGKGKEIDKKLNTLTIVLSSVFVVVVLVMYIVQPGSGRTNYGDGIDTSGDPAVTTQAASDETPSTESDDAADDTAE